MGAETHPQSPSSDDNRGIAEEWAEQTRQQIDMSDFTEEQIARLANFALRCSEIRRTEYDTRTNNTYLDSFQDAPSPTYELEMTSGVCFLTRDNTTVNEYPQYSQYNHIVFSQTNEEGTNSYVIWEKQASYWYQKIKDQGFDTSTMTHPSEKIFNLWIKSQLNISGVKIRNTENSS